MTEQPMREASLSIVTHEEIRMLFQGERRDLLRTREAVWSEAQRLDKLKLMGEG